MRLLCKSYIKEAPVRATCMLLGFELKFLYDLLALQIFSNIVHFILYRRLPDETGWIIAALSALPIWSTICASSYAKKYKR